MSRSKLISITSCLAIALATGCVEPTDSEPEVAAESSPLDEGAARFLAEALDGKASAESYTYEVTADEGDEEPAARVRTIGVGDATGIPHELQLASEASITWCTPASPTVTVSKSIWCESCNKNDAEDCARQWANTVANDFCEANISSSGGTSACSPATYTGDICVDNTSSGVTSRVQFGSDTACGTWPFRHAKWRVTYRVAGNCGYRCRSFID